ncbi:MAG: DUF342 domain-containing protein [bacterium]
MPEDKEKIKLSVSPDKLNAFISIEPLEEGEPPITEKEIRDILEKSRIVYGIKEDAIQQILRLQYADKLLIAEGIPPRVGDDGRIEYKVDLGKKELTPRENPNGTVDFREIGYVENVSKGDVLAVKIPPTEGTPGVNVYGEVIPPKKGKDIRLPRGKNTKILEDGLTLVSEIDGVPLMRDGNISVSSLLEINRDIDFSTGNIDFVGSVLVKGTVRSHFRVKCEGNLEVWEDIENADIDVGGNLIVRRGIYGEIERTITVNGNLIAKIIRNANINVKGDIIVEQGIMDSRVKCGGKIVVTFNKGMISGGEVSAYIGVYSVNLGSSFGTPTAIIVGKDPWESSELEVLIKEKNEFEKRLKDVENNIKYIIGYGREENLPEIRRDQLNKLRELQRLMIEQINLRDLKMEQLRESLYSSVRNAKVQATGFVYPGVKIWIGDENYKVDTELKYVYFMYDGEKIGVYPIR